MPLVRRSPGKGAQVYLSPVYSGEEGKTSLKDQNKHLLVTKSPNPSSNVLAPADF